MGRDGERCQTIYFFIYVMSGMGSATPMVVLDPCPHVPVLPNTAETYLGPQLPVSSGARDGEWAPGHSLRA